MDVRVVLADDHSAERAALAAVLTDAGGVLVVAAATTGHGAVQQALLHRPDVLVVDPRMPGLTGTAMVKHVLRSAPGVAVLVLATTEDDESVCAAVRAGVRGYIRKDADPAAIVRAVRCVAAGDAIFGPAIAARLTKLLTGGHRLPLAGLTAREHEVLELMAAGLPNSAVARQLRLATKTVSNHHSAILAKLKVAGRAEAIARARQAGLGRQKGLRPACR
ncbi:MAG TPA: response regulator transcription factor [Pseudonocardiaceae bacterium]|jgi:DNA-binding NarL/FixJ family response regulator|nr:response regulator transcription factor [Pseudonocardiaceae bacterium]